MRVEHVQLSKPKSNEAACACFGRFWSNFGHEIRLRFRKCERGFVVIALFTCLQSNVNIGTDFCLLRL